MSVTDRSACLPRRRSWAWRRIALLSSALTLVGACGGSDDESPAEPPPEPTAEVEVTATFPADFEQQTVAAVHLWVLRVPEGGAVTCGQLIGGDVDPYDLRTVVLGDVAQTDAAEVLVAKNVLLGDALVYVEAVDYGGDVVLAGCGSLEVEQPSAEAAVELQQARVFDCGAPETEEGSRCDDGDVCTVGERCDSGRCRGGEQRDCTYLSTGCLAARCVAEEGGCVVEPVPDGNACDDDLYCTEGDACVSGECVGDALDCSATVGPCQIAACDEEYDECVTEYAPYDTPCEDGLFCTEGETCDGYGTCYAYDEPDCSAFDSECSVGACDETTDSCVADPSSYYEGYPCTGPDDGDPCTTNACDGLGACVAAPTYTGASCDDGNDCTYSDSCDSTGTCVGYANTGATCTAPGAVNVCATYQCSSTGTCVPGTPRYEGYPCDGPATDPCSASYACNGAGACVLDCSSYEYSCYAGVCNPSTGYCTSQALTGTTCDYASIDDGICTAGSCGPAT